MRKLVGMRVRPEENALTRLLPYRGLGSEDASEDFGRWMTRSSLRGVGGQLEWRNRFHAGGSP